MIESITITNKEYKKRSKLSTINFSSGTNILLGSNGCGKSTIISLLISEIDPYKSILTKYRDLKYSGQFNIYHKDFEKDNPRTKQSIEYSKCVGFDLHSRFCSHGEVGIVLIEFLKKIKEPVCIIVDEPEIALDANNLIKVKKIFEHLSSFCQIIISTHNLILWSIKDANIIEFSKDYFKKSIQSYLASIDSLKTKGE